MPEGDTVRLSCDRLRAALGGKRLVRTDFRVPRYATVDLSGAVVEDVAPYGKHLLMRCETPEGKAVTVHSHLKMEGSWHLEPSSSSGLLRRRVSGIRAMLETDDWRAVGYSLGMLDVVTRAGEHDLIGHLGPDIMAESWSVDEAVARASALHGEAQTTVAELLLDQRVTAGIGTYFMCEVLFMTQTNPWISWESAPVRRLYEMARKALLRSWEVGFQTTTGSTAQRDRSYVHGRLRQPCRRCRRPITVGTTSSPDGHTPRSSRQPPQTGPIHRKVTERTVFYCRQCQAA